MLDRPTVPYRPQVKVAAVMKLPLPGFLSFQLLMDRFIMNGPTDATPFTVSECVHCGRDACPLFMESLLRCTV